jgi:uncharacterized protein
LTVWAPLRLNVARLRQRDNLAELRKRAAGAEELLIDVEVEANGLAITTARIPDGASVHVDGRIEAGLSGLELHALVSSRWEGECRRCVDTIGGELELDVSASFADAVGDGDIDADAYPIDGDWVDVGEVVREELMLALPLTPLCRDDCEGADPERFPTMADGSEGDEEPEEPAMDPRWAALSQLTFDEE